MTGSIESTGSRDQNATDATASVQNAWEHRTVLISRLEQEWVVIFADGDQLVGIDRVLDEYGGKGWELVAFTPHSWRTAAGQFGPYEVDAYRAVFKRPRHASSGGGR